MSRPLRYAIVAAYVALAWVAFNSIVSIANSFAERGSEPTRLVLSEPESPPAPVRRNLAYYAPILERDVFNPPKPVEPPPPPKPLPPLNVRLLGTAIRFGDRSLAVIEDLATGEQTLRHIGDVVLERRIEAIEREHIVLKSGEVAETLKVPLPAKALFAVASGERDLVFPEETLLHALRMVPDGPDAQAAAVSASVVPHFERGRPAGLLLSGVPGGSLLEAAGVRQDDVLKKINGRTLDDPIAGLSIIRGLDPRKKLVLDIVRGSEPKTLTYSPAPSDDAGRV